MVTRPNSQRIAIYLATVLALGNVGAQLFPAASMGPRRAVLMCNVVALLGLLTGLCDMIVVFAGAILVEDVVKNASWTLTKEVQTSLCDFIVDFVKSSFAEKLREVMRTLQDGILYTTCIWLVARATMVGWRYLCVPILEGVDQLTDAFLQLLPPSHRSRLDPKLYYGMNSRPRLVGSLYLMLGRKVLLQLYAYYFRNLTKFQGNVANDLIVTVYCANIATIAGALYIRTILAARGDPLIQILHFILKKIECPLYKAFSFVCGYHTIITQDDGLFVM